MCCACVKTQNFGEEGFTQISYNQNYYLQSIKKIRERAIINWTNTVRDLSFLEVFLGAEIHKKDLMGRNTTQLK